MALISQAGSSYCIQTEMIRSKSGQAVILNMASNLEGLKTKENFAGLSSLSCNSAKKKNTLHTDCGKLGRKRGHHVVVAASPPTDDAVIVAEPLTKEDLVEYLASGCKTKEKWRYNSNL